MELEKLNVIALISGGKDSFFCALHCLRHGHSVVALGNLYPAHPTHSSPSIDDGKPSGFQIFHPSPHADVRSPVEEGKPHDGGVVGNHESPNELTGLGQNASDDDDTDSFMYQTVGHRIVPLYANATMLPLYRASIQGGAVSQELQYCPAGTTHTPGSPVDESTKTDETESMFALLREIMAYHPRANAVCAGAILSTYQRTRFESVAVRLSLVPLSYLWMYPVLPLPIANVPSSSIDLIANPEMQLLIDMAAAQLDARIIKVASAGLDEDVLWNCVTSTAGAERISRAYSRLGFLPSEVGKGAVLGEGGEFETLVVDGPAALFHQRIVVPTSARHLVIEPGGAARLNLTMARLEAKTERELGQTSLASHVRLPELLDPVFRAVLGGLISFDETKTGLGLPPSRDPSTGGSARLAMQSRPTENIYYWTVVAHNLSPGLEPVGAEASQVVMTINGLLVSVGLTPADISSAMIILRDMADFSVVNDLYGAIFAGQPLPPARVTISCGSLLPEGQRLIIHLVAHRDLKSGRRGGLHVQARSYWAPANIGPYSQAIDVPLFDAGGQTVKSDAMAWTGSNTARCVFVAGQIPLVPATMTLPTAEGNAGDEEALLRLQMTLSLQHLWRIGADSGVQAWTSGVGYFSRVGDARTMRHLARLVGSCWSEAHLRSGMTDDHIKHSEEADDGGEVDPWDRKYGTFDQRTASVQVRHQGHTLPQRRVFVSGDLGELIPPCICVEVEELPRGASVEWHAHAGLAGLPDKSIVTWTKASARQPAAGSARWESRHIRATGSDGDSFLHSVLLLESSLKCEEIGAGLEPTIRQSTEAYAAGLRAQSIAVAEASAAPYIIYVDASVWTGATTIGDDTGDRRSQRQTLVVPCRSVWDGSGARLDAVCLFKGFAVSTPPSVIESTGQT